MWCSNSLIVRHGSLVPSDEHIIITCLNLGEIAMQVVSHELQASKKMHKISTLNVDDDNCEHCGDTKSIFA